VSEFFFEYGLFAIKMLTVLVFLLLAVFGIVMIFSSRTELDQESIEIEKINDKFDNMREALESEILSTEELKALRKQKKQTEKEERKKEKQEAKALKSKLKQKKDGHDAEVYTTTRPRLFVLRFTGDVEASEVHHLREAITAVLTIATPSDEVMIILESGGGYVHSYGLGASQLQRIRDRNIPLTVAVDLVAASGGYLMAVVANKILAAPFAIIGSIGVLAQLPNFNRLLEKYDVDIEQHTAGEYKTTLTMLGKNTDKDRKKFQQELEDTHILFKKFVAEHRPILDIQKIATGEHWYGSEALYLGLIDQIITSDDYLLNQSEQVDIYEVSYVITETLKDKLSHLFEFASKGFFKVAAGWLTKRSTP
jgi:serine protease SohB